MSSIWKAVSPTEASVIHTSTWEQHKFHFGGSPQAAPPPKEKAGFMDPTGLFSFHYVVEGKNLEGKQLGESNGRVYI